ncbi:MAG: hypothetical protein IT324_02730 [Anaerolineae bacterium]|nr:hypothetical protein [Anaerolineae bacterium]
MSSRWNWANLTQDQLDRIAEAEATLGSNVSILMAYQPDPRGYREDMAPVEQPIAPLTESQIECLRGLEQQLGTVIIAYQ